MLITIVFFEIALQVTCYLAPGVLLQTNVEYLNNKNVFKEENGTVRRTTDHTFIKSGISFLKPKPSINKRVFCIGGAALQGWPNPSQYSITSFLQESLNANTPNDYNYEIINIAASTYSSSRQLSILDECLQYEPDLIIVYSGNNEFLEKILYPSQIENNFLFLKELKLVQLTGKYTNKKVHIDVENYEPSFFLDIGLGQTSFLRSNKAQFENVKTQYASNLSYIKQKCLNEEIPVIFFTVPSNEKDWFPHASNSFSWEEHKDMFNPADSSSSYIEVLDYLLKIDSNNAHFNFLKG